MKSKVFVVLVTALLSCEYNSLPEVVPDERCLLHPDPGFCYAVFERYYFDQKKKCKTFVWGGCDSVVPFNTLEECRICEKAKQSSF